MAEQEDGSVIIEVEDVLLKTMQTELQRLHEEKKDPFTICRVPPSIRDKYSENFEPKIISIGPLHVGKKTLEPMKSLKWRYLQYLLSRCCDDEDMLAKYINKVRELEVRARKTYAEAFELDSDAFVQIMVLDACFIIEWLVQWNYGPMRGHTEFDFGWFVPLLRNDLLLLENQIPFFVLENLFELSNIPDLDITLSNIAISYLTQGEYETFPGISDTENVHHLLHLFQLSFLPISTQMITTGPSSGDMVMNTIKKIGSMVSQSFFWLLSLFLYCQRSPLKCWECHQQLIDEERSEAPSMIPTATELGESGVEFKRKKAKGLLNVTFRDGVMEIPLLYIDDETEAQYRNLIAFEQCCPTSGRHFTSYVGLLDNLIDTPKDVAILKKCGIIESMFGKDEEVADLFNSLCQGAYLDYEAHYLGQLFKDVNQYCEVDRHRWRARLMHDYFGNPWTIISVIAAIFLLGLTMAQTTYAILAYHKPPKQP